jgi:hypothetical protein
VAEPIPPGAGQGGVLIPWAEMYHEVKALREEVRTALSAQQDLKMQQGDHENRIRALERFQYKMLGAVVVIEFGIAALEYFLLGHK